MTAISVTAGSVKPGTTSASKTKQGQALEVVAAGKGVYYDTTTKKYGLHDANGATAVIRTLAGVALNSAGIDQPLTVHYEGPYTAGGTVAVGEIYVGGATPGDINPEGDLTTGWYVSVFGVGISTTQINVLINNSGVNV